MGGWVGRVRVGGWVGGHNCYILRQKLSWYASELPGKISQTWRSSNNNHSYLQTKAVPEKVTPFQVGFFLEISSANFLHYN